MIQIRDTLERWNEQQRETLERYRLEAHQLKERCEVLQGMVNYLRRRVDELERAQTPHAKAEAVFKKEAGK